MFRSSNSWYSIPMPRIAAVFPMLLFDMAVVDKGHVRTVGTQVRQQLIAELAVRNQDHIDLP